MIKRYDANRWRYFIRLLVNEPWFFERDEPVTKTKRRKHTLIQAIAMVNTLNYEVLRYGL